MKTLCVTALVILQTLLASAFGSASLLPGDLRCESRQDPVGMDATQPRLSWVLQPGRWTSSRDQHQSAYQVLVASSLKQLAADQGELWDSGKVNSDQSIQVAYAGQPLRSGQKCFWKVRVWDQDGKASAWSEPAR
ncbi:MAG TPA: alfa-L-rhamnosidase, partial [Bacillota bacterium]|nr:alfa-L-rhamnosidase [Bacillota bacterium]